MTSGPAKARLLTAPARGGIAVALERAREQPFSTRLRNVASLLLQLLALTLLTLAVSEPVYTTSSKKPSRAVVILDASASMGAVEKDGVSRFDHAVARIRERLKGDLALSETMILTTSRPPSTSGA